MPTGYSLLRLRNRSLSPAVRVFIDPAQPRDGVTSLVLLEDDGNGLTLHP